MAIRPPGSQGVGRVRHRLGKHCSELRRAATLVFHNSRRIGLAQPATTLGWSIRGSQTTTKGVQDRFSSTASHPVHAVQSLIHGDIRSLPYHGQFHAMEILDGDL